MGIPFPSPLDGKHITYVWFDALLNYITGANILFKDENNLKMIHIIGKDIIWFHSVIYPEILKSCNLDKYLPKKILVHGFIVDNNGQKMSKSIGNVIDVEYLINKYPINAIRNYLILETNFDDDFPFSEKRLVDCYNNELIKSFGNLFQRFCSLVKPVQEIFNKNLDTTCDLGEINKFLNEFINTFNFNEYKKKYIHI